MDRTRRRRALGMMAAVALAAALRPCAVVAAGIRRVGLLDFRPRGHAEGMAEKFVGAMKRLGFVEGRDIEYLHRYPRHPQGDFVVALPQLAALAGELVRAGPDAIVADGTAATSALVRATSSIPIVTNVSDPVGAGFARTLARPGGNVTGVAMAGREIYEKTFEFLKTIIPGKWALAMIVGDLTPNLQSIARAVEAGAGRSSIPVRRIELGDKDASEVDRAFAAMRSQGIRVVSVWAALAGIAYDDVDGFAIRHGLVTAPSNEQEVSNGALLAYDAVTDDANERKASQLARILRGTPAGEIPFEMPSKFRLTINLKTARVLGLTVPRDLLILADRIYE